MELVWGRLDCRAVLAGGGGGGRGEVDGGEYLEAGSGGRLDVDDAVPRRAHCDARLTRRVPRRRSPRHRPDGPGRSRRRR